MTPKEAIEIKPCPFCGGEAEVIQFYFKGVANRLHYFCQCKKCGARLMNHRGFRTKAKAIEFWNRRVEV